MILPGVLRATVRRHRSGPAILDDHGNFTWGAFEERVRRAAGLLRAHGLTPGRRFGLVMRNGFRQAELLWAGYWSGVVPVPINWRLAPVEVAAILADADIGLVVADDEFAGLRHHPECGAARQWLANSALDRLLDDAPPLDAWHEAAESDDALVLYTGGTTGRSKGVRLSHRAIVANAQQIGLGLGIRPGDVWMHVAPMFHAADLLGTVCTLLGGSHVYVPQFSGAAALAAIARHRVSATMMAPAMVKLCLDEMARAPAADLSSLRILYYGSSPMPAEWIRAAIAAFPGTEIVQGYGLTETAPILTVLPHRTHIEALERGDPAPLASAGWPVPLVDLRVFDDDGAEVAPGVAGELVVRGPNLMTGYLGRPDETAQALRDGWFHTGDVGIIGADGLVTLLDRKKDMIISGGENVYSSEVEAVLYQHPGVAEAAVIGVPDDLYGEAVMAVVAALPGTRLSESDLVEHCRGRIAGYKIPRRVAVVEALPKSAVGKILKSDLRRAYGGDQT